MLYDHDYDAPMDSSYPYCMRAGLQRWAHDAHRAPLVLSASGAYTMVGYYRSPFSTTVMNGDEPRLFHSASRLLYHKYITVVL